MSDKSQNESDAPKIIVDEDWKAQVEREKEELKKKASQANEPGSENEGAVELPPATFDVLVSMLTSQALAFLGGMPDPETGKAAVSLPVAKHFIDMLEMLEKKTEGNLTKEEATQLQESLHQLRLVYVAIGKQLASQLDTPDTSSENPSNIVLP